MKKSISFIFFFLIFTSFVSLNAQWAKTYGGSGSDWSGDVKQTLDGGFIVVGGTNSFGTGETDVWILKLDSSGNIQWQKTYGENEVCSASSIQQTNEGGYIVAGHTLSSGVVTSDVWILKLDSSGNVEWQKTYGGNERDLAASVQQVSDGGYTIVCLTRSFGAGDYDIWILKLDSTGEILWQRTYGGNEGEAPPRFQQTADGGYIVTCRSSSFGTSFGDIWVLKLDSAGNIQWQNIYGGGIYEYSTSIQNTSDGGFIVSGMTQSFGAGGSDFIILKLNSAGEIQWKRAYGGSYWEYLPKILICEEDYVVAGYTKSFGMGESDFWILRLDSAGNIHWQYTYGGIEIDESSSFELTNDGGFIIAGKTRSFNVENSDILLVKLFSDGTLGSSCELIGSSEAIVSEPNIYSIETNVLPHDTYTVPRDTYVFPQDTDALETILCFHSPSPEEQIENLIDDVEDLFNTGQLNEGLSNALAVKLEAALQTLEVGNTTVTCNQLRAFINQVEAFINAGVLSDVEGQAMIDLANEVINELCG